MSILQILSKSGPFALGILGLLGIISIGVWAAILHKSLKARRQRREVLRWHAALAGQPDLQRLQELAAEMPASSFGRVTAAALAEVAGLAPYVSFDSAEVRAGLVRETVERVVLREKAAGEELLGILAIASAVGPLMGLLGTVWGIMHSFLEIGNMGSANITVVAPGIAEALITTIVGLAVAIPANVAYNYFADRNRKADAWLDDLGGEILTLFKRGDLRALEEGEKPPAGAAG